MLGRIFNNSAAPCAPSITPRVFCNTAIKWLRCTSANVANSAPAGRVATVGGVAEVATGGGVGIWRGAAEHSGDIGFKYVGERFVRGYVGQSRLVDGPPARWLNSFSRIGIKS